MSHFKPVMSLLVGLTVISLSSPALAVKKPDSGYKGVHQGPIFNPKTNSYFELWNDNFENGHVGYWGSAKRRASAKVYKGRKGRLAVVKDLDTLNFIRANFRVNQQTWIGSRFYCRYRKLVWVTGESQPPKSPGMWANPWYNHPSIRCSNQKIEYMNIFLTPEKSGIVAWRASGPSKSFFDYIVEYPAPPATEKEPDDSDKKAEASGTKTKVSTD